MDNIFYALAHPVRRKILDLVKDKPGCEAGELANHFNDISRVAVRKHIKILQQCRLLIIEDSGRNRLHYFNVMPIQAIYERWTDEYSRFFAPKLHAFKLQLESDEIDQEIDDEKTA